MIPRRYREGLFYVVVLPLCVVGMIIYIAASLTCMLQPHTVRAFTTNTVDTYYEYEYEYTLIADHTYRLVDTAANVVCYYLDEGGNSALTCVPIQDNSFIPEGPNP